MKLSGVGFFLAVNLKFGLFVRPSTQPVSIKTTRKGTFRSPTGPQTQLELGFETNTRVLREVLRARTIRSGDFFAVCF